MGEKQKILVVDDEPSNIFIYKGILEEEGFEVTAVSNGEEALNVIAKDPPALVLSDLLMPRVHGFDLLRALKENEEYKHIPVIISTAVYRGPVNRMEARKMGADIFLEKPVEPDVLLEAIRKLLRDR